MLPSRPLHKKLLELSAGCASDRREQARKWSLMTGALTFGRTVLPLESAASGVQFGLRAQEGGGEPAFVRVAGFVAGVQGA